MPVTKNSLVNTALLDAYNGDLQDLKRILRAIMKNQEQTDQVVNNFQVAPHTSSSEALILGMPSVAGRTEKNENLKVLTDGRVSINKPEAISSQAKLDIGGSLRADSLTATFFPTAILAGIGDIVWDGIVRNSAGDLFNRSGGNTIITVREDGWYDYFLCATIERAGQDLPQVRVTLGVQTETGILAYHAPTDQLAASQTDLSVYASDRQFLKQGEGFRIHNYSAVPVYGAPVAGYNGQLYTYFRICRVN